MTDKVYCLLPYVHFQVWPNGDAFPCCFSANDYEKNKLGNISNFASLDDVANSQKQKDLRVRMRDGGPLPECVACVKQEAVSGTSFRLDFKESFSRYMNAEVEQVINTMQPDGTLKNFKMKYMDVRWSTICNQKCRTCGPHFSSSWAMETAKATNNKFAIKVESVGERSTTMHDELLARADEVDVFYFAGGEPLVTPEHFEILDRIDMTNKTVVYNTNFSNLNWRQTNVLDKWKNIPRLTIHASVDATYAKYDYMRSGTSFATIVDHFKRFHETIDNSYKKISINLTTSALNVLYLPEIITDFYALGFLHEDGLPVNVSFVFNPEPFKVTIFTKEQKEIIKAKLLAFAESPGNGRFIGNMHSVINFMESEDDSALMDQFKQTIASIDSLRNESFSQTFPELSELIGYE